MPIRSLLVPLSASLSAEGGEEQVIGRLEVLLESDKFRRNSFGEKFPVQNFAHFWLFRSFRDSEIAICMHALKFTRIKARY